MRSLVVLLFALSCSWGAQTYVVCAGVEKYRDERITPLQFAVADAKATAAAFRAAGVSHRTLTLLTSDAADPEHQPTRINLLTALEHVKERATREDKVVVFFAGHGVEQDGQQFLLSSDTRLSLLAATALPMALVNEALRGLQAQEVLFLIDACRNNPNSGRAQTDAPLTESLARGLRPQLDGVPDAPRPRLVATLLACEVGQRAWEDPEAQHGVFTEYLLQGLAGQAAEAGAVRLSALAAYVTRQLRDWSARTGKAQAPKLVNPEGGDMVVLVPPGEPVVSVAFSNRTLAEVIGELGEQYGAQITLGRGADPNAKVTGRLEAVPLGTALKALLAAYDLRVRRAGSIYVIEARDTTVEVGRSTLVVAADGTGDCKSIGEALRRAPVGAQVQIEPGVYPETVVLDKDVELKGNGEPGQVVVEATGARCLWVTGGSAKVSGLTFRQLAPAGAATDDARSNATAVAATGLSQLVIEDCEVSTDWPTWHVLSAEGANVVARRVHVKAADARVWAGLNAVYGSRLTAEDCSAEGARYGGGAGAGGRLVLRGCQLRGAAALYASNPNRGRPDCRRQSDVVVDDCTLEATGGPVVELIEGCRGTFRGCRFRGEQQAVALRSACLARVDGCDLTAARGGAFAVDADSVLLQQGNTLAETDETAKLAFTGPVLTVAPEGGDYTTIGAAVQAAQPGSLILVRPGCYRENLTINKSLQLRGDGPCDEVVLEAVTGSCLDLSAGSIRVAGLTIRQLAVADPVDNNRYQTPIHVGEPVQLVLTDCVVVGPPRIAACLWAAGGGASVRALGVVLHGPADEGFAAVGWASLSLELCSAREACVGLNIHSHGRVVARGCRISGSEVDVQVWSVSGPGYAELTDCELSGGQGRGVAVSGRSQALLTRCTLTGHAGAGVSLSRAGRAIVQECNLQGNRAGAYELDPTCRLEHASNQYDTGDATVPAAPVVSPTITVAQDGSGTHTSIADALNHAAPGSTIRIKPGTYREAVSLDGLVTLVGDGPRDGVVLEATGQRVVTIRGQGVSLQGLTIRQLAPPTPPADDWLSTAPLSIEDAQCSVTDCQISTTWGVYCAVWACRSVVTMTSCHASGAAHEGFSALGGADLTLVECRTSQVNTGTVAHSMGVVHARKCQLYGNNYAAALWRNDSGNGRMELIDCDLTGGEVGLRAKGGSTAILTQCRVTDHTSTGVVVADRNTRVELDQCTVTGNARGAFELVDGGRVKHTGCIFDASDTTVATATRLSEVQPNLVVAADGSGDCQAITAALNRIAPGGTIHVKPGTYREALTLDLPVTLIGDGGRDQVVIEATGQTVLAITSRDVAVQGLTVRLAAPATDPAGDWRLDAGVLVSNGARLAMTDCRVTSTWHVYSTFTVAQAAAVLHGCQADGPVSAGFSTTDGATLTLDTCRSDTTECGGQAHSGGMFRASHCQLKGDHIGLLVWRFDDPAAQPGHAELDDCDLTGEVGLKAVRRATATLTNCRIARTVKAGVVATGAGTQVDLRQCTVTSNGQGAFELKDGGQISHTGCTFDAADTTVAAAAAQP